MSRRKQNGALLVLRGIDDTHGHCAELSAHLNQLVADISDLLTQVYIKRLYVIFISKRVPSVHINGINKALHGIKGGVDTSGQRRRVQGHVLEGVNSYVNGFRNCPKYFGGDSKSSVNSLIRGQAQEPVDATLNQSGVGEGQDRGSYVCPALICCRCLGVTNFVLPLQVPDQRKENCAESNSPRPVGRKPISVTSRAVARKTPGHFCSHPYGSSTYDKCDGNDRCEQAYGHLKPVLSHVAPCGVLVNTGILA